MDRVWWRQIGENAREGAIEWHLRLASGEAGDADYRAFADWLSGAPERTDAFLKVEAFSGRLERLRRADHSGLDHLIERGGAVRPAQPSARPVWRRASFAALAASLLVLLGVGVYSMTDLRAGHAVYAAAADGFRTIDLSDGSTVVLGPGATFETDFKRAERRVSAFHGAGYFKIAHDKSRPFTIAFGARTIRVVGTEFEVSSFDAEKSVAVAQGVVTVSGDHAETGAEAISLRPGERFKVGADAPGGVVDKVPLAEIGSWRDGYFTFENTGVEEVVQRLNAFYGTPLFSVSDDSLKGFEFNGILKLSDPQGTARRLSELFPVDAVARDGGYVLKDRRAG